MLKDTKSRWVMRRSSFPRNWPKPRRKCLHSWKCQSPPTSKSYNDVPCVAHEQIRPIRGHSWISPRSTNAPLQQFQQSEIESKNFEQESTEITEPSVIQHDWSNSVSSVRSVHSHQDISWNVSLLLSQWDLINHQSMRSHWSEWPNPMSFKQCEATKKTEKTEEASLCCLCCLLFNLCKVRVYNWHEEPTE